MENRDRGVNLCWAGGMIGMLDALDEEENSGENGK